jgi:DNA-binding MarR family transcriptional regulator
MATDGPVNDHLEDLFPADRISSTAALLRANIAVGAAFTRLVNEPIGIDREQSDLIVRLATAPGGGLRGIDIAAQLRISPTRVSRLADRAEADGLIERQPDPDDRRAQRLVLTAAGTEVAHRFAPRMHALLDAMIFAEFSAKELGVLTGLLDRLSERATELVEAAD